MYKTYKEVPAELESVQEQKEFDKSRVYQLDKSTFSFFHGFFKQVEFLVCVGVANVVGADPVFTLINIQRLHLQR